jgi:alkanesulfonate monooxygenase SsuD/methylene tetrahydromethanopterin reductase-like flavin-dependent oxidoreductase (luciferase family)
VAHEAASLHHLSGGRFELGIGAGWYKPEYSAAGLAFDSPGRRIDRLEESLAIISGLLAGRPVHHSGTWYQIDGLELDVLPQRRGCPRLLIGAGGPRMLRVAARHADIVGLLPAPIRDTDDRDDPLDRLPRALDDKLAVLRTAAGDRFGQRVRHVQHHRAAAREHRGTHRAARLGRDRCRGRVADAGHLHRQRGPDP